MVNNVTLKKAQNLRRKSMLVGMRFIQEKVSVTKAAENANVSTNYSKANTNDRPS